MSASCNIYSRQKASDSGASVNLDTVQSVPHPTDSPPSNDWHSSADAGMVFTVIETPVYCLFCAAKDCDCTRRERLDLSEVETLAEVSRKIVAEGEEELVRQKEAEELDAAIRELIDFASVVKKRPEIMNPAYIPIVEGCLQELALLAMLHSQGRIALRPETPKRATIEELPGNSSQSAAASDTGICRNLPKMSDDLVGDNHNKRERRESPTESFAGEKFIPTEGLRRVAWPPPSDVTVHPSQVPLNYNQQPQDQQQYQPAAAPAPAATSLQDQFQAQNQFQTQSYQTTTSYQATETQQHQQYYQPAVRQPSPGVITLRTELPVSQAPAPVYASQPPVFSFKGGSNMRGDQKWPPVEYKQQAAAENEARLRLAAGPACRPRRCNKDYTAFFAKNALSHNYPGYRVPPGTQHVNGQSMM
ncbi:uncharacterized protein LOC132261084 isoform X5 [Phlebotomus argentipes]|uniref:uncharacterized protein LOC132261084 isoform X5 n=1 Tax=Phlebotomus argentipes TaxID=94469 RepID=UPI002892D7EF|nr:uncharacterized protein LOC132261084 isoform X5 [Phlebotomus argentipes]